MQILREGNMFLPGFLLHSPWAAQPAQLNSTLKFPEFWAIFRVSMKCQCTIK